MQNRPAQMGFTWDAIRAEYLAGGTSYRKLAAKYGLSRRTLEDRARSEHWAELRGQVRGKVVAELPGVVAREVLDEAAELTTAHFGAWQALSDQVAAMLPQVTKPSDLLALANAFRAIVEGQRKVLGLDDKRQASQADGDLEEAIRLAEDREVG